MSPLELYSAKIENALQQLCDDYKPPVVEYPKKSIGYDLTTNTAMANAKKAGMSPRELAEKIISITKIKADIAGPGFINFNLENTQWVSAIENILTQGNKFGFNTSGQGKNVNLEFVSANPTGPLHVGHLRGAITGDVLGSILEASGYNVTREYYINDAGSQIDKLMLSIEARWQQHNGKSFNNDNIHYPGDYITNIAKELPSLPHNKDDFKALCVDKMMALVKNDLRSLNIIFDTYTNESSIINTVPEAIEKLKNDNLVYEGTLPKPLTEKSEDGWNPRQQLLFKSTQFGDQEDRPLTKSDDSWTYFASDIAYHYDKSKRTNGELINIWGADHGGYLPRINSATKALTGDDISVILVQMVNLVKNGKPYKMGKRTGNFITVKSLLEDIPVGVIRFYMAMRASDTQMSFDLDEALTQSKDNPYWYIQYAITRINSAEEVYHKKWPETDWKEGSITTLSDSEIEMTKILLAWPTTLERSARDREPQQVVYYLNDLARAFHSFWSTGKKSNTKIVSDDLKQSQQKTLFLSAVKTVLVNGLKIIGCEPVRLNNT